MKVKIDRSFKVIDQHSGAKNDPTVGRVDPKDTVVVKVQDDKGRWLPRLMTAADFVVNPESLEFEKNLNTPKQRLSLLGRVTGLPTEKLDSFKIAKPTPFILRYSSASDAGLKFSYNFLGIGMGLRFSPQNESSGIAPWFSNKRTPKTLAAASGSSSEVSDSNSLSLGLFLAISCIGPLGALTQGKMLHSVVALFDDPK